MALFSGTVVALGQKHGIKTPVNAMLYEKRGSKGHDKCPPVRSAAVSEHLKGRHPAIDCPGYLVLIQLSFYHRQ
ncbi:MAG: hypothetical protein KAY70_05145 [Acetobacterium sp.]|nr:hypothetical protein [Acetobacterium sp.]MBP8866143.1 hypothetical protein [Acetobacterium sp.]